MAQSDGTYVLSFSATSTSDTGGNAGTAAALLTSSNSHGVIPDDAERTQGGWTIVVDPLANTLVT